MKQLLTLVLYIAAAAGCAWLVIWGAAQAGLPSVLGMMVAIIVFVLVVIFGLNRAGVADL